VSQLHIHANQGDVAPFVLLPGDPKRAQFIAETFFEDPVLYNDYRYLLGYTGSYKGMPVSVQTTGMGCPSLAIVVEEIIRLGAKTLVRVGTSGIIKPTIKPGEVIIAQASVAKDGTSRMYLKGEQYAPCASFAVTRALVEAAESRGASPHVGLIQTEDAFYATTPSDVKRLEAQGILAVEMEASTLFLLGALRQVQTGCALVASNYIGDPSFVDPEILKQSVEQMVEMTLEAGLRLYQAIN
jgi:purine-nucleoside phosphorylase